MLSCPDILPRQRNLEDSIGQHTELLKTSKQNDSPYWKYFINTTQAAINSDDKVLFIF